jgi:dTDP-4-dehydrorhamnose 3,5-epimerase-like enzyme
MNFEVKKLKLPGVLKIAYDSFHDHRGSICTTFDGEISEFISKNIKETFNHDKFVLNKKNVLRGIHYDCSTSKIVTCLSGRISQFVICVDEKSAWFGHFEIIELRPMDCSVLIPKGYGNAFVSREDNSIYHYKLAYSGSYVDADQQLTIKWNDSRFKIPWDGEEFILSSRDE